MTEQTTTTENAGSGTPAEPSGVDLARLALQQARLAARSKGSEAKAPRRRRATTTRRDGQEPSGFAAVLAGLMADRAWELPAAGGSVLDRWPDIATAVTPHLHHHVRAVAFHPETGQLDLRPDSSAYATQLRLTGARIITAANEATGTSTVRTIRVLSPGTPPAHLPDRPASPPAPAPAAPQAPGRTPEAAPAGYREAIAAHRATWTRQQHTRPEIQAAAERQLRERLREPEENFADGRQALAELRAKAGAQQQVRTSDVSRARALQRLAAEQAGLATITPAAAAQRLDRTA
ncbi:DciA family protein [Streptomyces anulatus]|uniref:DciA family protein n=1 Tax=Streptomyces anulatus TaxID=1892 RepID=UPI003666288E